jgi:hypothetical protein
VLRQGRLEHLRANRVAASSDIDGIHRSQRANALSAGALPLLRLVWPVQGSGDRIYLVQAPLPFTVTILAGFVNVAWGRRGSRVPGEHQNPRQPPTPGIGRELVRQAAENAKAAGCEWLHVDFEPHLARFYLDACRLQRTDAGLIHSPTSRTTG